jgi:hypothetical protein
LTPGPWYGRKETSVKNPVTPPGVNPRTVPLVAQHLNHYTTPAFSLGTQLTPGPWYGRKEMSLKNPVTPPGIDPRTVQLVAQCLNHYATQAPLN